MTRSQLALLAAILVASGALGVWAWSRTPSEERAESPAAEERSIPLHRERSVIVVAGEPLPPNIDPNRVVQMADAVPSPPDAESRRRFDGRWTGDSDAGPVTVLLLDGVGDLLVGSAKTPTVWGFEIFQYFGDDFIEVLVWAGDDAGAPGHAAYLEGTDSILVEQILGVQTDRTLAGLPRKPFTVRRGKVHSR